jgi:hypothetical protein
MEIEAPGSLPSWSCNRSLSTTKICGPAMTAHSSLDLINKKPYTKLFSKIWSVWLIDANAAPKSLIAASIFLFRSPCYSDSTIHETDIIRQKSDSECLWLPIMLHMHVELMSVTANKWCDCVLLFQRAIACDFYYVVAQLWTHIVLWTLEAQNIKVGLASDSKILFTFLAHLLFTW